MVKKRTEWVFLGRILGTATGWDQGDTFSFNLYDFEPAEGVDLPKGDPFIDLENGTFELWSNGKDPVTTTSIDLIDALKNAKRQGIKQ